MTNILTFVVSEFRSLLNGLSMAASSCSLDNGGNPSPCGEILVHIQQAIKSAVRVVNLSVEQKQNEEVLEGPCSSVVFPVSFMRSELYREYQKGLLLIEQSQISSLTEAFPILTLKSFAHGVMFDLSRNSAAGSTGSTENLSLSSFIGSGLENCSMPPDQLVPFQCLQWLTEVSQPEEQWVCWVHDMWYRWQRNLWDNCLQEIPSGTVFRIADGVELSSDALDLWSAATGANNLYQVCNSVIHSHSIELNTSFCCNLIEICW